MSQPITEFLLARISEDEALANAAIAPDEMYPWGDRSLPQTKAEAWGAEVIGYLGGTWGDHSARWNPLRVLAECKTKRAIIGQGICIACHVECQPCDHKEESLARLAAVYADHPDYMKEWKPEWPE